VMISNHNNAIRIAEILTICDDFRIINNETKFGIITIDYRSRITGKQSFIGIDVFAEKLSHSLTPIREEVFRSLLANEGFWVSPLPCSLDKFLHLLLYPRDGITIFGKISSSELPVNADIKLIGSTGIYSE
jgi:hypothetical protein